MTRINFAAMSVDQLVERFIEIGVAQSVALDHDAFAKYNHLFGQMVAVNQELCSRGREAHLALTKLYDFPNMQVRLKAATYTLTVVPDVARRVLQSIADSRWPPQAMHAGMLLNDLNDDGTWNIK